MRTILRGLWKVCKVAAEVIFCVSAIRKFVREVRNACQNRRNKRAYA